MLRQRSAMTRCRGRRPVCSAFGATRFRRRTTSAWPAGSLRRSPFSKNASRTTRTPSARATSMLSLTHCSVRGSDLYGTWFMMSSATPPIRTPCAVGRLAVGALHVRPPQLQVVVHAAHRDLHAVEPQLLRDAPAPRSCRACRVTSRRRRCWKRPVWACRVRRSREWPRPTAARDAVSDQLAAVDSGRSAGHEHPSDPPSGTRRCRPRPAR